MRIKLITISVLLLAPLVATAQQTKLYRWVDENGQVHFSDSIPPEYAEQPKQRIDQYGIAREEIAGKKSSEQLAAEKRAAELEMQAELQKRADQALLVTYQSVEEIEMHRDRRIQLFQAQARVTEEFLASQRRELETMRRQAARFKPHNSDPDAPDISPKLAAEIKETEALIARHEDNLRAYKEKEAKIVRQFEGDISRFRQLKGLDAAQEAAAGSPQPTAQTLPE